MLWITFVGLREILATTLAAQIAVLPLLLWESGMLSLVAVPANMLVLPLVPLAMALSAIAAVVAWVVPSLGTLAGVPAYLCLWWIIHIAKEAAGLPLSHIIILPFSFAFVLASYAALLAIGVWLHQHPPATI
jgi:competence protein ComEC